MKAFMVITMPVGAEESVETSAERSGTTVVLDMFGMLYIFVGPGCS